MNLRSPRAWIAFCSLAAVSFVAVVDTTRTSPGPLATVHGRVSELSGRSGCSECHGGMFSNMTDACLECHATIEQQLDAQDGLHGMLEHEQAQRCGTCHGEHHGERAAIVNVQSFARAGVKDPEHFEHQLVGFLMDGRHLELGCIECHANAVAAVLPEKGQRFGGLDQNCVSCHEDVHEGKMQVDCAACHGQTTWDALHSLGHERQLPLVGGHGDVECRACHAENGPHALEVLGSARQRPAVRACLDCHESPHKQDFVAAVAGTLALTSATACVSCHAAEHQSFREESLTLSAEQHALTGFVLDLPHDDVQCSQCHARELEAFATRHPGRKNDECSACHADPHQGQFAQGPFSHGDCIACHDRERFEPHAFTLEKHALSALELTGQHVDTACNDCHERAEHGGARVFRGTAASCDGCHADAHAGFFAGRASRLEQVEHGECARCHSTQSFTELAPNGFDHERWTSFAIAGAHAQGACETCHARTDSPDDSGRTFGVVAAQFGKFEGCVTCHEDVHAGQFDRAGLPSTLEGRSDCARCHVESSFRTFPNGFDHGRWTGFALAGGHAQASCSACHAPLRDPNHEGRTWQAAPGARCSDCHLDPHAGQFKRDGANDCARCHTDKQSSFSSFDHDRDSRFALDANHVSLDCAACHLTWNAPGGVEVVRYRPLGTECTDCHGVQGDVLQKRKRRSQ